MSLRARGWLLAAVVVALAVAGVVVWAIMRDPGGSTSAARVAFVDAATGEVVVATLDGREVERVETGIEPTGPVLPIGSRWVVVSDDREAAFVDVFDGSTSTVELPADSIVGGIGGSSAVVAAIPREGPVALIDREGRERRVQGATDDAFGTYSSIEAVAEHDLIAMPVGANATTVGWFDGDDVEVPGTLVTVTSDAVLTMRGEQLELFALDGRSLATFPIELPLLVAQSTSDGAFIVAGADGVVRRLTTAGGDEHLAEVELSSSATSVDITSDWIVLADDETNSVTTIDRTGAVTRIDGFREQIISGKTGDECLAVGQGFGRIVVAELRSGEVLADVQLPGEQNEFVLAAGADCTFWVGEGSVVCGDGLVELDGVVAGMSADGQIAAVGQSDEDGKRDVVRSPELRRWDDLTRSGGTPLPADSSSGIWFFEP
jgi:hypothetical protein